MRSRRVIASAAFLTVGMLSAAVRAGIVTTTPIAEAGGSIANAPSLVAGEVFNASSSALGTPFISDNGVLAYYATAVGTNVNSSNNTLIVEYANGTNYDVAQNYFSSPDANGNNQPSFNNSGYFSVLSSTTTLSLDNLGDLTFQGNLQTSTTASSAKYNGSNGGVSYNISSSQNQAYFTTRGLPTGNLALEAQKNAWSYVTTTGNNALVTAVGGTSGGNTIISSNNGNLLYVVGASGPTTGGVVVDTGNATNSSTNPVTTTTTGMVAYSYNPSTANGQINGNAPGTSFQFGSVANSSFLTPCVNASGQVAFEAQLNNSAGTFGIWSSGQNNGNLHLLALEGQQISSSGVGYVSGITGLSPLSSTATYNTGSPLFNVPDMNNAGQTVFSSTIVNDATDFSGKGYPAALFTDQGGSLKLVLKNGDPAPGTNGYTFNASAPTAVINDAGIIAFIETLTNGTNNSSGIFEYTPNQGISLIAQVGQHAVGLPGENYSSFNNYLFINKGGQVAFMANLSNYSGGSMGYGLFAQDNTGALNMITASGQQLQISPGVYETVSPSTLFGITTSSGGEDGRNTDWSDDGTFTFKATFATGSAVPVGIFTASVPEPASITGVALVASALLVRRPRKTRSAD